MNGAITWEQIYAIAAIVVAGIGVWSRFEYALAKQRADVAALELKLAEHYVTKADHSAMETKLLDGINRISDGLSQLNKTVMETYSKRRV